MGRHLGAGFLGALLLDVGTRPALDRGPAEGWLILCFAGLAVALYAILRGSVLRVEPDSFAWRYRAPWLVLYFVGVLLLIAGDTIAHRL
jgi:hypothetical protein